MIEVLIRVKWINEKNNYSNLIKAKKTVFNRFIGVVYCVQYYFLFAIPLQYKFCEVIMKNITVIFELLGNRRDMKYIGLFK